MKVLRIVNWNERFENNRTRDLKRLDWFPIPNKHDGDSYTEILDHTNGMAHYGAWVLIVAVASKCDPRGTLLRDGAAAHDARSLARKTRGSAKMFEEALPRLLSVRWLEWVEVPSVCNSGSSDSNAPNPASDCENPAPKCEQVPIEGNGIEGKRSTHTHIARVAFAIPASEAEAVEFAVKAGVAPDFARSLYHQCEGRGWVDGAGNEIQMWSSYAKGRFLKEAFNKPPISRQSEHGKKAPSVFEIKTVIQAKEALMAKLKNEHCGEGLSGWNDDAKRREFSGLKREVKELTEQLSKAI